MTLTKTPSGIALLVDENAVLGKPSAVGPRSLTTLEAQVLRGLRLNFRAVEVVPFTRNISDTVSALQRTRSTVVFNVTECLGGDRRHDAAIVGLLEMLGTRVTGTGSAGLILARDKIVAKMIATSRGIRVPKGFGATELRGASEASASGKVIVKPQFGDGSDEIYGASIVSRQSEARKRAQIIRRRLGQPAMCEEFIEGKDVYVSVIGRKLEVLPPVELASKSRNGSSPRLASFQVKHNSKLGVGGDVSYRKARIGSNCRANLERASRVLFSALCLRGFARFDFRVNDEEEVFFLEANPNPALERDDAFAVSCGYASMKYEEVLQQIVLEASGRNRSS